MDNPLLTDTYFGDKTIHVFKQKEAQEIQESSYLGFRKDKGGGHRQDNGTGEKPTGARNGTEEVLTL